MRRVAAVGILLVLALTGCSPQPETKSAVVSADGVTFRDGADGNATFVSFDLRPEQFAARLTDVLGKPTQTQPAEPDDPEWKNVTWGGLGVFVGLGDPAPTAVFADVAEVRGYALTTTDGYQVGKPFPLQGAEASCALGDNTLYNSLPDSSGGRSITLQTASQASGGDVPVVSRFMAPTFVQGC